MQQLKKRQFLKTAAFVHARSVCVNSWGFGRELGGKYCLFYRPVL